MINLSLPYFKDNMVFNNFIYHLTKTSPEYFKETINIEYVYGSFNWTSWNGGINSNRDKIELEPEMQSKIRQSLIPVRIDFSNCNLLPNDYFSRHEKTILDIIKNSSHVIELSDLNLMSFIQQNINENFTFIMSEKANIFAPLNSDIINELINIDYFSLITVLNPEEVKEINKNKLEIVIGNSCYLCPYLQQLACIKEEQEYQINFSGQSKLLGCTIQHLHINYMEQIKNYQKKGFSHFKIEPIHGLTLDYTLFNLNFLQEFIKPEYLSTCLIELREASNGKNS